MKIVQNLFFVLMLLCLPSCDKIKVLLSKSSSTSIQTEEEKISYLLAYVLTENTKSSESDLRKKAFLKGVKDSLAGKPPALEKEELNVVYNQIQKQAFRKRKQQKGDKSKMEGQKFLEANKKKSGVKVTASGLQYEVLKAGQGKTPSAEDTVEVHYRGTLLNGTEFDSSYKRNSSISFPLNGVIKGWTEGLQLMKEGAKYKFYIPSELAYGEQGAGQSIPPHSTLIFEVELLKVK